MVTTGLAFISFAFVYIIVDARRWWSGAPFLFAGNTLHIGKSHLVIESIYIATSYWVYSIIFISGFTYRPEFYCAIPWSSNGMENVALQLWAIWWNGNSLEKTAWITLGSWMLATCSLRNAQKKSIHYHFMNNYAITLFFIS